jgi:hypothetical protein
MRDYYSSCVIRFISPPFTILSQFLQISRIIPASWRQMQTFCTTNLANAEQPSLLMT